MFASKVLMLLVLLQASRNDVNAFYVPGVHPETFEVGQAVPLKVNSLTSTHT